MWRVKKHRLSGPAVFIGYLLLIPSFIGMAVAIMVFFAMLAASPLTHEAYVERHNETLIEMGISPELSKKIAEGKSINDEDVEKLTDEQKDAMIDVQAQQAMESVGTGVAFAAWGLLLFLFAAFCLGAGLLGWILTMKKKVLQCSNCKAVVATS